MASAVCHYWYKLAQSDEQHLARTALLEGLAAAGPPEAVDDAVASKDKWAVLVARMRLRLGISLHKPPGVLNSVSQPVGNQRSWQCFDNCTGCIVAPSCRDVAAAAIDKAAAVEAAKTSPPQSNAQHHGFLLVEEHTQHLVMDDVYSVAGVHAHGWCRT
jgi:hypothetical protein